MMYCTNIMCHGNTPSCAPNCPYCGSKSEFCDNTSTTTTSTPPNNLQTCQCHSGYDWTSYGVVVQEHCMETVGSAYCHPGPCYGSQIQCQKPTNTATTLPPTTSTSTTSQTPVPEKCYYD